MKLDGAISAIRGVPSSRREKAAANRHGPRTGGVRSPLLCRQLLQLRAWRPVENELLRSYVFCVHSDAAQVQQDFVMILRSLDVDHRREKNSTVSLPVRVLRIAEPPEKSNVFCLVISRLWR